MISFIASLGYLLFALATVALVWAAGELVRKCDSTSEWKPGTNPHAWRF